MISSSGEPHPASRLLAREIEGLPSGELKMRQKAAERALMQAGITFNVYSDNRGVEKTLPFDLIPRIVSGTEWNRLEKGLQQRILALNLFLDDLYHDQKILKDGIIPRKSSPPPRASGSSAWASSRLRAFGATSRVQIWCGIRPARSWFSRTTSAARQASPM